MPTGELYSNTLDHEGMPLMGDRVLVGAENFEPSLPNLHRLNGEVGLFFQRSGRAVSAKLKPVLSVDLNGAVSLYAVEPGELGYGDYLRIAEGEVRGPIEIAMSWSDFVSTALNAWHQTADVGFCAEEP